MSLGMIVRDRATAFASVMRIAATRLTPQDIEVGGDTFRGIIPAPLDGDFCNWIRAQGPYEPTLTFARKSPIGQQEPHYIHHDAMMGDWTAILYLNLEPHPGDGTVFWQHASGANSGDFDTSDALQFTRRFSVRAQFNRAVIFPSKWFHSRALFENYGTDDNARLIQVAFGKVV